MNKPNGGFPPIYVCDNNTATDEENKKNREFIKKKGSVSIIDIMKQRKEVKPFII